MITQARTGQLRRLARAAQRAYIGLGIFMSEAEGWPRAVDPEISQRFPLLAWEYA